MSIIFFSPLSSFNKIISNNSGFPIVKLPVLSKTTTPTSLNLSKDCPDLTRIPFLIKLEIAIVCTIGTAKANAHGQVIIKTAVAFTNAASQPIPK